MWIRTICFKFIAFAAAAIIGVCLLLAGQIALGSIFTSISLVILILRKRLFEISLILSLSLLILITHSIMNQKPSVLSKDNYVKNCSSKICVVENQGNLYKIENKYGFTENDYFKADVNKISLENNSFNYSENLKGTLLVRKIYEIKSKNSIRESVFKIMDYNTESSFLKWILFGMRSDKEEALNNRFINMGVIHMIVISGFHISLIFKIFEKINPTQFVFLPLLGCFIYLVLLNFSVSSLRSFSLITLTVVGKKYQFHLKPIQNLSILVILFLLFDPMQVMSMSFLLSFSITYWVLKFHIKNKKTIIQSLFILFLIYLSTVPWTISINSKINTLSFLYSILLTPIFSLAYIVCFFTFFIGYLAPIHHLVHKLFGEISKLSLLPSYIKNIEMTFFVYVIWYVTLWLISYNFELIKIGIPIFVICILASGIWHNQNKRDFNCYNNYNYVNNIREKQRITKYSN